MKVLYVCTSQGLYGDNIAILSILPFLKKLGVEPIIFTPMKGAFTDKLDELGYYYITGYNVYSPGRWPQLRTFRAVLGLIRRLLFEYNNEYKRLRQTVEAIHPHIIHTNLSTTTLGYKLSKDLGIPHVWHIREYGDLDHGYRHFPTKNGLQKKLLDPINRCIFITEDIFNYFGKPQNGCAIYDGVIRDNTSIPLIKSTDKGYFLYVGRLVQTKGIDFLLSAYLKYARDNKNALPLIIAGKGSIEYEAYLRKLCAEHENGGNVEYLGYRTDIPDLMSNARALIVPSRFEAFGFISVEAMFYGCPVIGHNVAGTKCQFDNGISLVGHEIGFRFNNETEFVQQLQKLTNSNRINLLPMLYDAQKAVINLYSAEDSAERVYKVYKDILKKAF